MSETKAFEIGDKVRHRASGELAIVTGVDNDAGMVELSLSFDEKRLRPLSVWQFVVEPAGPDIVRQELRYGDIVHFTPDGKLQAFGTAANDRNSG